MSDKERKIEQSMRLFEALADVSPELLARSEKKAESKVVRLWGGRFGRYAAACLAILLVGGISLYAMKYSGGWKNADNAALQNSTVGGASSYIRQGSVAEQIAEQIEADGTQEAAGGLYAMDLQQGQQAVNAAEGEGRGENGMPTEQQSSLNGAPESGKDSFLVYNDAEKDVESENQQKAGDAEKESLAELSVMQSPAGYLTEEDVARMGSLAAYAPVSLPQGYTVSDTRIAVDESGVGNYVIVMRSGEGNILEYRVSRGEEDSSEIFEDQKESNVICVTDLKGEEIEEELTELKPDDRENTIVAMLYGDGVRVEVRGTYTLEILREICPED